MKSLLDIEDILKRWNVRYTHEYNFLRVFGNYNGYSIIRYNHDDKYNPVELNGRVVSVPDLEDWIYTNCK